MIQLGLKGIGLLLLALTMFSSPDQIGRTWGIVSSLLTIGYGIVYGIKRKPSA
jgi:hypothetical protein